MKYILTADNLTKTIVIPMHYTISPCISRREQSTDLLEKMAPERRL